MSIPCFKDFTPFLPPNSTKFIIIGDIHLNTSKFPDFEKQRLYYIVNKLNEQEADFIVLNGDIIDKAYPTLEDIQLFYKFVTKLKKPVFLLPGNHEEVSLKATCYDYLPHINFTFLKKGIFSIFNYNFYMISHPYIHLLPMIQVDKNKHNILISHYRSELRFASSEVDNNNVSRKFDYTILSDIHSHFKPNPFNNIEYTSSPTSIKFEPEVENGFILAELKNNDFEFNFIELFEFKKIKLVMFNKKDYSAILTTLDLHKNNLYKIVSGFPLTEKEKQILTAFPNVIGVVFEQVADFEKDNINDIVKNIKSSNKLDAIDLLFTLIKDDDLLPQAVDEVNTAITAQFSEKSEK